MRAEPRGKDVRFVSFKHYKFIRMLEILFGVIWLIGGLIKLFSTYYQYLPNIIDSNGQILPPLQPFFSFFAQIVSSNPYGVSVVLAILEFGLAFCLMLGFMRRVIYPLGIAFVLLYWAIVEAFGFAATVGITHLGAGLAYAIVLLLLFSALNVLSAERHSLDSRLRKRISWWKHVS